MPDLGEMEMGVWGHACPCWASDGWLRKQHPRVLAEQKAQDWASAGSFGVLGSPMSSVSQLHVFPGFFGVTEETPGASQRSFWMEPLMLMGPRELL